MTAVLSFRAPGKKRMYVPSLASDLETGIRPEHEAGLLRTVGWVSAGAGALVLGLFVGRELRSRYKFTRRTPYDFYAHSGDSQEMEFGVGV